MGASLDSYDGLNKSSVSKDRMFSINGALYCNLERGEHKLNPIIIKGMKKINRFSCEYVDTSIMNIKQK